MNDRELIGNRTPNIKDFQGKKVFMIGICGSSMSGLARFLKDLGFFVSGSTDRDSTAVSQLCKEGIPVTVGHRPENVEGAALVVYTTAIPEDHVELMESRRRNIPILDRPELLGQIFNKYKNALAVCGTHGKTTTVSMLTQILVEDGKDPSIHIGGELPAIGGGVRIGGSDIFVTEACEYKKAFLHLYPKTAVVLNIDRDHLDCYADLEEIEAAFGQFMRQVQKDGRIIANGNDRHIQKLLKEVSCRTETFGWTTDCDWYPVHYQEDQQGYAVFELCCRDKNFGQVRMSVPGRFNVENAMAALAAAYAMGVNMDHARQTISTFHGAKRRFERTSVMNGTEFFHDYGHNPTEIRNAISIARKRCQNGRLWAVLQPHTFSRLRSMFSEYVLCTAEADITLVTDVFQARETDPGDLNSGMLVQAMRENGVHAIWTPSFSDAEKVLISEIKPGDLVITLGCGNINQLNEQIADHFGEAE